MRIQKLIIEIIASLLVLLFLYTGLSKFLDFAGFRFDIDNQPFPNSFTPVLVWILPLTEIAIAGGLCFERTRLSAFRASLILMSFFTIYTALVLLHVFSYVPCSCGGVIKYLTWSEHLLFNLFFTGISFAGIKLSKLNPHHDFKKNNVRAF